MRVLLLCCAAVWLHVESLAQNWPQFRGPMASGLPEKPANLPTEWDVEAGKNVGWRTRVPGLAHASPIVWENTVYVATVVSSGAADLKVGLYGDIAAADDNGPQTWRLLAIDKGSGKILWNKVGHEGIPRV